MLQSPILAIRWGKALATFLEQAGNSASQWVKTQLCSGGGFLLDNLPAIGPAGRAARETARGLHGAVCGVPTPPELGEPTLPTPPFAGGQCQTLYRVSWIRNGTFNGNPNNDFGTTNPLPGPIGGITTVFPPAGGIRGILAFNGGTQQVGSAGGPPNAWSQSSTITITSVQRADGLPDNCGSPPGGDPIPPPPPPPLPPAPDIDLPVTPPGGGPDIDFTFSPRTGPIFIGIGGALVVPVNVRVNGPNINVNAPISIPVNISLPDFNISFPGQGGGGGEPDNPDAPPVIPPPPPVPGPPRVVCCDPPVIPGPEIDSDDDPPEPVPKGLRFIGIRVSCTVNPALGSFTVVGQGGGVNNLYLPRLANVYFDVRVNNQAGVGQPASVGPIPVQLLRQYIPAPEGVLSVNWRVVREPGVTATVIPLFVPANRT